MYNNNEIKNDIADLVTKAQHGAIYAVIDALQARIDMYTKALQNGRDIWSLTYGERFKRLHEQRSKIWLKIYELQRAINIAFETIDTLK